MRLRSTAPSEYPISDFQGLNRKDAAQRVRDNQFYNLQNWYHAQKGVFQKRFGTTSQLSSTDLFGANRVSAIHRHYNPNGDRFTLHFCEPNSTPLPDNTVDLTFMEAPGQGNLFGGGAVQTVRFCYSWVGLGTEQSYNTRNRAGFVAPSFNSPVNAWAQAHQTFTPASNTSAITVTAPATWPTGVKACNVFAALGSSTQMCYVGTIYGPSGQLTVQNFIGPNTAFNDAFGTITCTADTGGTLKPGTYYVSLAWIVDPHVPEGGGLANAYYPTYLSASIQVTLGSQDSAIKVSHSLASSTNGAKSVYVFVGTQDCKTHPMMLVNSMVGNGTIWIIGIPDSCNAQSFPAIKNTSTSTAIFDQTAPWGVNPNGQRFGYILKRWDSGVVKEILPSRSIALSGFLDGGDDPIYGTSTLPTTEVFYSGIMKTANDRVTTNGGNSYTQPYNWGRKVYDPQFAYLSGLSYFVNGSDIPWQTDGYTIGQITRASGTLLPPYPRFITVYQNSLVVAGSEAKNTVYFSNALQPNNWSDGGTGTNKNFLSIGNLFGDEVTALGVFTLATDGVNNPRSFIMAFKKHGIWMKDGLTSKSVLDQLSGRTGCIAYRSITSTNLGLVFLGSDGEWYLVRSAAEPVRIATSVQPIFNHLVGNDTLMRQVTAVFHDLHLKACYPSSSSSTYNDAQLWADLRTGPGEPITWVGPHTGINIGPQIVLLGESDDMSRIGARSDTAQTVLIDDQTVMADLGTSVTSVLESKTFRFRSEAHMKRVLGAIFDAYWDSSFAHSILFEGFADADYQQINKTLSTGGATWDSTSFDSGSYSDAMYSQISCLFSGTNLNGRTFKFKFTHSNPAQFILAAAVLLIKPERRMVL